MALDTNLTPEIVNSFNVYIDGVKAIGTAPEITLPQITSETIDVSGSGILGKISTPNIGQFESIEQEVSFNLVYSSFVNVLSPKRQVNLTFRVAQQAVDKSLGYAYKGLRIVEIGRVKEFTPGKIKAGEGMEAKVKLELTYLMIENDGEEIIARPLDMNCTMRIGMIKKKNAMLSRYAQSYTAALKKYATIG